MTEPPAPGGTRFPNRATAADRTAAMEDAVIAAGEHVEDEVGRWSALVVVWPNARAVDQMVLGVLLDRLTVLDVTNVHWSPDRTLENYNRFLERRIVPPYSVSPLREHGEGPLLAITVAPAGSRRNRQQGVSAEMLDEDLALAVARIRAETGGAASIHHSPSGASVARDLMMLLGRRPPAIGELIAWDGIVRDERRDVIGADGWDTAADLFRALDAAGPYVILRNYEGLPDSLMDGHEDIDLLTSNYRGIVAMAHAKPLSRVLPRHGGRFHVVIGHRDVLCDIRVVGDDYYPAGWATELLTTRQRFNDITWVPSDRAYHESLLYHALIHKPSLSEEYRRRLDDMARALGDTERLLGNDPARPAEVLKDILSEKTMRATRPRDPSVFFNHRAAGLAAPTVRRLAAAVRRRLDRWFMQQIRGPVAGVLLNLRDRLVTIGLAACGR